MASLPCCTVKSFLFLSTLVLLATITSGDPNITAPPVPKNINLAIKCCPEPNILKQSDKCRKTLNLNCTAGQYMIDPFLVPNDAFEIEDDGSLNVDRGTDIIPKEEYCITLYQPTPDESRYVVMGCFNEADQSTSRFEFMGTLTLISVVFIGLTLYVYRLIVLRDTQDRVTQYALICLFIFFLTLGLVQLFSEVLVYIHACTTTAIIMHFFMLAYFSWINCVMANVWKSVVVPRWSINEATWYRLNHIYAWSVPIIIDFFVLFGHFTEHPVLDSKIGSVSCWFASPRHSIWYMYGPISFMISINIVLFIWTCLVLNRHSADFNPERRNTLKYRVVMYLKLFLLVGLSWIFEILGMAAGAHFIWIFFDIVNAFHGLLIFLVLVVFRARVKRELAGKRLCFCFRAPDHWRHNVDVEHQRLADNDDEGTLSFRNNNQSTTICDQ